MSFYRQLLVFTVPSVAVLFGIYWYRRRRGFGNCDPGGSSSRSSSRSSIQSLRDELEDILERKVVVDQRIVTPTNIVVKSAPIDIVPNGANSQRSSPVELSDRELDLEIEKARSQRLYVDSKMEKKRPTSLPADVACAPVKTTPERRTSNGSAVISCLAERLSNSKLNDNNDISNRLQEENSSKCTKSDSKNSTTKTKKSRKQLGLDKKNCSKQDEKKSSSNKQSVVSSVIKPLNVDINNLEENDASAAAVTSVENDSQSSTENRDSANHSPCDNMLSPSIGHFSDNHSEGSNDSGKGCSESPSPPPTNVSDVSQTSSGGYICHQFLLPKQYTGYLMGMKKSYLHKLNSTTGAKVYIKEYLESEKYNICCIEGCQQDVDIILEMIKQRLPAKKFSNISLKDITPELCKNEFSLLADCYNLHLVEGVNNDVIISCYVNPSQLFVQQPMHPTYPSLHILHTLMGVCYQDPSVPRLPNVVKEGMICAAPTANNWYRTQVINTNKENDSSLVKLVDFGGFMDISNSLLKQIRGDFMMLPFQAIEIQLAGIAPIDGGEWSPDAVQIIAGLTTGQILQAQVVGYNDDCLPQVYLYLTLGPQQVISLNQELVVRGLAQWVEEES